MYEYEYDPPPHFSGLHEGGRSFLPQLGGLEGWKPRVSALGLFFFFFTGIGDVVGRAWLWGGFGWV